MEREGKKLRRSIHFTLTFVALIWLVKIIEITFSFDFGIYGILPRTLAGSTGIITAPLIHGDFYHLISNTFPILILGIGLFYFYDRIALEVILLIYLITGFWVWIAAREAYHIGASGLIYGMLTFLLLSGFLRRDSRSLALSFVVLFLYGGTFFTGIFPTDVSVSWESHLMGGVAGVFCAVYFKNFHLKSDDDSVPLKDPDPEQNYSYSFRKKQELCTMETKKEKKRIIYTVTSPFQQLRKEK